MCVCLCLEMAPESGSIQTAGERDWTGIVLQNPIKSIDFISKVKPFENMNLIFKIISSIIKSWDIEQEPVGTIF